ncbi:MAG: flexitail domain-containing putative surface protein [Dehalococcoidia bacterium]
MQDSGGNSDIYVMSAGGFSEQRVTSHPAGDTAPDWASPPPNAPRLAPIGPHAAIEGLPLQITVNATDANGGPLEYSMWTQTPGATFVDRTFTWAPTPEQVRSDPYPFWFFANDGQTQDSETIWITVVTATGDTDFDQLMNADEFNIYHTNPLDNDTDHDYLSDYLEVNDYGTDPLIMDSDRDGCLDSREVWNGPEGGGDHDPLSFWDFMDVWNGLPVERDRIIGVGDIGGVVARFGASRAIPPTPAEAVAEALTPPAATTGYHAAFDRSGSTPGGHPWDLLPPDGTIAVGDIGAVVVQFGHSCV